MADRKNANNITDADITALYDRCDELALLLDLANGMPSVYRINRVPFIGTAVVRSHQIEPVYSDADAEVVSDV